MCLWLVPSHLTHPVSYEYTNSCTKHLRGWQKLYEVSRVI